MLTLAGAVIFLAVASELTSSEPALVGEGYTFSEGPVWAGETVGWLFNDVPEQRTHALDGSVFRSESGGANGMAVDPEGRIVSAEGGSRTVTRREADGSLTVLASAFEGKRLNAPNDVVIAADGTIYFTDPMPLRSEEPLPLGFAGVFAIDPSGELKLLTKELPYPNGIGLSPDEKTLYVAMTAGRGIQAFDITAEGLSNSRKFAEATIPDGLAVDVEGRVWCAVSGGVAVYSPAGEFIERIKTRPTPTNCAFGGPDGSTLLITARQNVYTLQTSTKGVGF